jgi:polyisoprenoid-binding protein YceI
VSTTVPAEVPTTGTWQIDTIHSTATFSVKHLKVATFRGHFHEVTGALVDGELSGSVQTENIDVGRLPMFKEHLMATDWFDVANFPTLSFRSTDFHAHDGQLHAAGELTIKGVSKPVDITGTVTGPLEVTGPDGTQHHRLGLDLSTTVNRKDFNIVGEGGPHDDVTIDVSLALTPA